jgi:hypothetical protein
MTVARAASDALTMALLSMAARSERAHCTDPTSAPPLTSQRLKKDEDRLKYHGKALEYGTDGVRGGLRVGNQIVEKKAHDQEDDEPLDPRHRTAHSPGLHRRLFEHPAACTGRRSPIDTKPEDF